MPSCKMAISRCRAEAQRPIRCAPPYQQLFAVRRPVKAEDLFGRKMTDLAARFAVERLSPEVVLIVLPADGIHHSLPIRGDPRESAIDDNNARVGIENPERRVHRVGLDYG